MKKRELFKQIGSADISYQRMSAKELFKFLKEDFKPDLKTTAKNFQKILYGLPLQTPVILNDELISGFDVLSLCLYPKEIFFNPRNHLFELESTTNISLSVKSLSKEISESKLKDAIYKLLPNENEEFFKALLNNILNCNKLLYSLYFEVCIISTENLSIAAKIKELV